LGAISPKPKVNQLLEVSDGGKIAMLRTPRILPYLLASLTVIFLGLPSWGASKADDEETIRNATTVLQAMLASKDIPPSVLAKADCIIVLPSVKKFAVGIGGTGGRGPMTCREGNGFSGKWSPPAMYTIGGASAGFQVGGKASDIVVAIMAPSAVDKVLNSKVKVGTDVSAAAGPGASAGSMGNTADMLTYSRSSGLFAGASIDGASLDPDAKANERLYGKEVSAKQVVSGSGVTVTSAGQALISELNTKVSKHE
jgi:lipid-binding SYLF domain-containing protein